ncbi:MAG: peroxiredoxin [Candidatus Buchananbacteria bacterium CG10_big_fil_rev_8_21_14_0_10_42_9]|uniref:thioredoxin-dependent peroxiredoxin n=1 Tax=Candidatus Buchananbacteria bacterium CG10_big_fil_rev_8_21_14_0_10_42_9 TaxID=1974526 RepID=A0A2H0VZS0_9BACT|nr:MAG: peroxiredoxin [Candidatus Buchananbacteria bacterium CG10_big_fil_rev_8_21_14_0_10_42_9]
MLKLESQAPTFSLTDKNGASHSLKDYAGKILVLYFYPKDNTPGCTLQAQNYTRHQKQFAAKGIAVVGISGGDQKSKQKFVDKCKLRITLLSDPDFKVSLKYKVYGPKKFMGREYMGIKRTTYIIGKKGIIKAVVEKAKPQTDPQDVLQKIKELNLA